MRIIGDRECKKYAPCCNVNALLLYQQRYAPSGGTKEICTLLSIQNDMTLVIWLLRTPRAAAVALIDGFSCSFPVLLFTDWFFPRSHFVLVIDILGAFFSHKLYS